MLTLKPQFTLLTLFLFAVATKSLATPAISVTGSPIGVPSADSSHAWEFTPNIAIVATHLGLLDGDEDGIDIEHPIGIFRLSDSLLLTSGTIASGVNQTLIDGFRYVDTPDVILESGEAYAISYYSATVSTDFSFGAFSSPSTLSIDPAISFGPQRRWEGDTGGLVLPANMTPRQRIGPNFLFNIVPEPSSITLVAIVLFSIGAGDVRRWRSYWQS